MELTVLPQAEDYSNAAIVAAAAVTDLEAMRSRLAEMNSLRVGHQSELRANHERRTNLIAREALTGERSDLTGINVAIRAAEEAYADSLLKFDEAEKMYRAELGTRCTTVSKIVNARADAVEQSGLDNAKHLDVLFAELLTTFNEISKVLGTNRVKEEFFAPPMGLRAFELREKLAYRESTTERARLMRHGAEKGMDPIGHLRNIVAKGAK